MTIERRKLQNRLVQGYVITTNGVRVAIMETSVDLNTLVLYVARIRMEQSLVQCESK